MNYSAKLEKYNKVLGSRLIAAGNTYREALEKHYDGNLQPTFQVANLDDLDAPQDIVVLSLPEPLKPTLRTGAQPIDGPARSS